MITENQRSEIIRTLAPLQPRRIGIFGSFARDENGEGSDLDILISLDQHHRVSLLSIIAAEQELSDQLGVKVDLVTERSLNPMIKQQIEQDLKVIYG
jgi:uncharacterized protein